MADDENPDVNPEEEASPGGKGGFAAPKIAQKIKAAAVQVKSTAIAILVLLKNPYFWLIAGIIALVTAVIIFVIGLSQVVGKNENADGCIDNAGGVSVSGKFKASSGSSKITDADRKQNAAEMMKILTSTPLKINGNQPLSKEQAAAAVGNAWRESTLDPGLVQGGALPPDASNEQIKGLNGRFASAVGLFQMTDDRLLKMVAKAESMGVKWNDGNAQMQFLIEELEQDNRGLKKHGFFDPGRTIEQYTAIWNYYYEGSCDNVAGMVHHCAEGVYDIVKAGNERVQHAKEALTITGGGSGDTSVSGGSCMMDSGGSNFDASGAVQLALSIAIPMLPGGKIDPKARVSGDASGQNIAPPAYKAAKAKAEQIGGKDPMPGLYASCDRFVATVTKITMDKDIPWGDTSVQYNYLSGSPKWERFSKKSQARPGDIFVTVGHGHIIMYTGNVNGIDTISDASYHDRVGATHASTYLSESLVDHGGRQYAGFHFRGN